MPSKGMTHPYLARALMADLDFMEYRRVILKSDQGPSIVALCDAVKNGWHGEIVPQASPKGGSKSNGEVVRAVQSVHGVARTRKDFLEQQSGITWESRSPLLAWLVEHCSDLLLPFTIVSRTTVTQPTCVSRATPGELSCRVVASVSTTESTLDTSWSRGSREVCSWVFE